MFFLGSFESGGAFPGRRAQTIERSVMSGCGQGHEPEKKISEGSCGSSFSGSLLAEVEIQVKEGGTSLHNTFRGINLPFKGLKTKRETFTFTIAYKLQILDCSFSFYVGNADVGSGGNNESAFERIHETVSSIHTCRL